ncbi:colanic acid biosynthesis glycosyltransferase WcaL [Chlorobium phaeovibrioides]|uniref:Glycosyltransferase n=1 Tax=Chlorobium phaeovibrioides TaxID=1094 RepID=A0A432AV60_CHLPH|nr:glycosyltransferase family 4 protein [Chlorobium phaeovibrioides]KAA6231771.1 glycosyltransferase family 4 protein [Chlorobium phaeovibrioides]MWV54125.1 glycosyltransferase [Chlorobium phaeovibrioides]QEQ57667.1 glycosyltransferase family 4 protein [Chlorobium phaeovibrioides]RTY34669.1 colanic acid biosynthesis glycosyltransferase WcaL [Chlorobium phaeovibrioides]RTY37771.1 colanic acid biosynthesis glycosyltransferase WcaL [Chlorobium phaeovibrioides]
MNNATTIAYLCSEYPAVSHTFIFREIESLRRAGILVHTATIRRTKNLGLMTASEQDEAKRTFAVITEPLPAIFKAHAKSLIRNPAGYMRMAAAALKPAFTGPCKPIKAAAYFIEAGILLEWLHGLSITHVHEHFGNPTAIVAMLMKTYGGISYSISVHGPDIFYQIDSAMLDEKVRHASFVRCISHYCRSQIMRISPSSMWGKHHIVRCGVDPDTWLPRPEPDNEVPQLLCVGRLVPAKGQHILLNACALLKNEGVRFHLTLIGDGPDRTSLEQFSREHGLEGAVTFTGVQGQDKVREWYDMADMFILASFAEGVPVVLMEAMAKEIPVISTRITGIPELIEHGHNGLLATPADTEDLARKIRTLIEDPEMRKRLGREGRKSVERRYNQHINNNKMVDLFKQAVAQT